MSRFFRSGNSTSSSESESSNDDDDDVEATQPDESESALRSFETQHVGPPTVTATSVPSRSNQHRDFLLHALLEERCVNEVLATYSGRVPRRDAPDVQAEANRRYHTLCERLASYNLISTGLEEDRHSVTRQRYRDGLDILSHQQIPSANAVGTTLRRLLTEPETPLGNDLQLIPVNAALTNGYFDLNASLPHPFRRLLTAPGRYSSNFYDMDLDTWQQSLTAGRFHQEFEQIGTLGSGGYGIVYQVKHRLDGRSYAVKKVPLSSARIRRIQERGQPELEGVLKEIRTLARLDHPNIVRYYTGWFEWVVVPTSSARDTVLGAEDTGAASTQNTIVESNSDNLEGAVIFEHSNSRASAVDDRRGGGLERIRTIDSRTSNVSEVLSATHIDTSLAATEKGLVPVATSIATATNDTESPSFNVHSTTGIADFKESTFALHMQMSLHPMTLDHVLKLAPCGQADKGPSHCFHLAPCTTVLIAVLNGLEYLHAQGIIHRDIKPGNIFLGPTNENSRSLLPCSTCNGSYASPTYLEVRIGDFGLVSFAQPKDPEGSAASSHGVRSVGTKTYLPFDAEKVVGTALDVYALGIVGFELLYEFSSMSERADKIAELKLGRFPDDFCRDMDAGLRKDTKDCVLRMLRIGGRKESVSSVRAMLYRLKSIADPYVRSHNDSFGKKNT